MIAQLVIHVHTVMLLTPTVMIFSTPKIHFVVDSNFILLLDQSQHSNCVGFPLGATRSALGLRVLSVFFGPAGLLLCSKCCNLLFEFGLHLGQFSSECDDLIFLSDLAFPCSILKHVDVGLNTVQ